MVDEKLGSKRLCESCGAKFYDLNKLPAICPKCGAEFAPPMSVAETPAAPQAEQNELENEDDALTLDAEADEDANADDTDALAALEGGKPQGHREDD